MKLFSKNSNLYDNERHLNVTDRQMGRQLALGNTALCVASCGKITRVWLSIWRSDLLHSRCSYLILMKFCTLVWNLKSKIEFVRDGNPHSPILNPCTALSVWRSKHWTPQPRALWTVMRSAAIILVILNHTSPHSFSENKMGFQICTMTIVSDYIHERHFLPCEAQRSAVLP